MFTRCRKADVLSGQRLVVPRVSRRVDGELWTFYGMGGDCSRDNNESRHVARGNQGVRAVKINAENFLSFFLSLSFFFF